MWLNPQETADFVTFTEEILNGKLHFCAVWEDSLAIAQDSFKDCIFARKIEDYMDTNFEERKVPQASSGCFAQMLLIYFIICGQHYWKHLWSSCS